MFETAVGDGANQLGLQKEVAETSRVNADVGTFLVDAVASRSLSLLAVGGRGGLLGLELLVRVVDQILLSRHVGGGCKEWKSVATQRWRKGCQRDARGQIQSQQVNKGQETRRSSAAGENKEKVRRQASHQPRTQGCFAREKKDGLDAKFCGWTCRGKRLQWKKEMGSFGIGLRSSQVSQQQQQQEQGRTVCTPQHCLTLACFSEVAHIRSLRGKH